jgi:hypothetical protein
MSLTHSVTITALCATALVGCSGDAPTSDDPTPTAEEVVSGAPVKVSPGVSAISEAGDSAFFSVTLATRPRGQVVVNVTSSKPSEARVFPSRITFNPHDWNKPRTITVESIEDDDFDGDIPIQLVFAPVQSTDRAFSGYRLAPIDVLSVDDDYKATRWALTTRESSWVGPIRSKACSGSSIKTDSSCPHRARSGRSTIVDTPSATSCTPAAAPSTFPT